jgi:outer membrane lipoprotein SlyB
MIGVLLNKDEGRQTMKRVLLSLTIILMLVGCASYKPVIDHQSIYDTGKYEQDLAECQAYAQQIDPGANAAIGAVGGAAVGAALGAIVGAFFGCPGETAGFGAALFGAGGGLQGAGQSAQAQKDIVIRCMQGRGYRVLY